MAALIGRFLLALGRSLRDRDIVSYPENKSDVRHLFYYKLKDEIDKTNRTIVVGFAYALLLIMCIIAGACFGIWAMSTIGFPVFLATVLITLVMGALTVRVYFSASKRVLLEHEKVLIVIECNNCERVIRQAEHWICPRCKQEVTNQTILEGCPHCKHSALALRCPTCRNPIPLQDGDVNSCSWWATLLSEKHVKIEPSRKDRIRQQIMDRVGTRVDLRKIRRELLEDTNGIQDEDERRIARENIEAAISELNGNQTI